jgi:hypothetical protein
MPVLCPLLFFVFDVAQFFLNISFLIPNAFGIPTPDLTANIGSAFGCNF